MPDNLDDLFGYDGEAERQAFGYAATVNANDVARERRLAERLGVSRETVAIDPAVAENRLAARDAFLHFDRMPIGRALVREQPDYAPLSIGSTGPLVIVENLVNDLVHGGVVGIRNHRLGELTGQAIFNERTPELNQAIALETQRIQELRLRGSGGFLEPAGEVVTAFVRSFASFDYDSFRRRSDERAAGAQPVEIYNPIHDGISITGDFIRHLVQDAFYQAAGPIHEDQVRAGVDPSTAKIVAGLAGTINAALDFIGLAGLTAFVARPAKMAIKRQIDDHMRRLVQERGPAIAAASQTLTGYAAGVALETTTEGLQAVVEHTAGNIGRGISGIATVPNSELGRNVVDSMSHALKASIVLFGAGGIPRYGYDLAAAKRTERANEALNIISKEIRDTPVANTTPELAAAHVASALSTAGIDDVSIPVREAVQILGRDLLEQMGVDAEAITKAESFDTDVNIPIEPYMRFVGNTSIQDQIAPHVRLDRDGLTQTELEDFENSGRLEELERLLDATHQSTTVLPRDTDATPSGQDPAAPIADRTIAGESESFFRPGAFRGDFDLDADPIARERLSERGLAALAEAQALADELTGGGTEVAFIRAANGAPAMFVHSTGNILLNLDPSVAPVPGTPEVSRHTVRGLITHESVHVLRLRGAIPAEDWSAVTAAAQENGWLDLFNIHERYAGLSPSMKLEEAVAEAAAAYQTGERQSLGFAAEPTGSVQRVLMAVGRLYRAGLRFLGLDNRPRQAEEVLSALSTGELGSTLAGDYVPLRATWVQQSVANLEDALGLKALFRDAADAGMTERQYESYIAAWRRASQTTETRLRTRELNKQRRAIARLQSAVGEALRRDIIERLQTEQPAYRVLSQLETLRLDRADIEALGLDPNDFPTFARGRKIYATKRDEPTVDINVLADVNDYNNPREMLEDLLTAPPIESVVEREVANDPRTIELADDASQIEADLELLGHDDYARVLTIELNALRAAGKGFTYREIRAFALRNIGRDRISDITPQQFHRQERRHAKEAARALRGSRTESAGNVEAAVRAKFLQHLNYEKARAIYRIQHELARKQRYIRRFTRRGRRVGSLPPDSLQAIRTYLGQVGLHEPDASDRIDLAVWASETEARTGHQVIFDYPETPADGDFRSLRLEEFRAIEQKVREIESIGRGVGKETREARAERIEGTVAQIAEQVRTNLPVIGRRDTGLGTTIRRGVNQGGRLVATPRTIVELIDGGNTVGPAFRALLEPYRRAMTDGFAPALKTGSERLRTLWDNFTKEEQVGFYDILDRDQQSKNVKTGAHRLGLLLNLGNDGNRRALIDGGVTEAEIELHVNNASQKEFEYVQGVWDLFGEYWPQIAETIRERRNEIPVRVEAVPLNTPFGQIPGGYYGIAWDTDQNARFDTNTDAEEFRQQLIGGNYVLGHTNDGHTRERQGGGGRAVDLDPIRSVRLLERVLYDVHVGDSVRDAHEILRNSELRRAFEDRGRVGEYADLSAWLNDIAVGEVPGSGILQMVARHFRSGLVVFALGYNLRVAALQPLGIANTIGSFGGLATARGITTMLRRGVPDTPTMQGRQVAFNADQEFIRRALVNSLFSRTVRRFTPGESAEWIRLNALWPIVTAQRIADGATWYAAADYGKRKLGLSGDDLVGFSDQSVLDVQGTQIQGLRSAFERGSVGSFEQSDLVRSMAVFMNYFIAKNNVAIRRARNTPGRLGAILSTGGSLAAMYAMEGAVLEAINAMVLGDDRDEDDSFLGNVAASAVLSAVRGVPGLSAIVNAAFGRSPDPLNIPASGAIRSILNIYDDDESFNIDVDAFNRGFFTGIAKILGVGLRIPGGAQAVRTVDAAFEAADGEEVPWWAYIFGVRR